MGANMQHNLDYSKKDSAIGFIMAIFLPLFFVTLLGMFLKAIPSLNEKAYYYILLVTNQLVFFLGVLIYSKCKKINTFKASKFKFNLNFKQILIIIAIGLVAMYGFSSLVNYFDYLVSLTGHVSTSFSKIDVSTFPNFLLTLFVLGFMPAICEEILFRGQILQGLKKYNKYTMAIICGLMFCIMHLSIQQFVYQFVLGVVLAMIVMITGSILSSIILHLFNNTLILTLSFISKDTGSATIIAPQNVWGHILPFLLAILSLVIIFALMKLLAKCTKNPEYDFFDFNNKKPTNLNINSNAENVNTEKTINQIIKQENLNTPQNRLQSGNNENTDSNKEETNSQKICDLKVNDSNAITKSAEKIEQENIILESVEQGKINQDGFAQQNIQHNMNKSKKSMDVGDLWIITSLVVGVLVWIVEVVTSFMI